MVLILQYFSRSNKHNNQACIKRLTFVSLLCKGQISEAHMKYLKTATSNFGVQYAFYSSQLSQRPGVSYCYKYGVVRDVESMRESVICGTTMREFHLYTSMDNRIELSLSNREADVYFLLRYEGSHQSSLGTMHKVQGNQFPFYLRSPLKAHNRT